MNKSAAFEAGVKEAVSLAASAAAAAKRSASAQASLASAAAKKAVPAAPAAPGLMDRIRGMFGSGAPAQTPHWQPRQGYKPPSGLPA